MRRIALAGLFLAACGPKMDEYFLTYETYPKLGSKQTWKLAVLPPTGYMQYTEIPREPYGKFWLYMMYALDGTGRFKVVTPDTGDTSERYLDWVRTVYGPPGLDFSLSQEAYVSFSLYNTTGQKVYSQDLGLLEPGPHTITLQALRSGVYVLFIKTNEKNLNAKLVFTRQKGGQ